MFVPSYKGLIFSSYQIEKHSSREIFFFGLYQTKKMKIDLIGWER